MNQGEHKVKSFSCIEPTLLNPDDICVLGMVAALPRRLLIQIKGSLDCAQRCHGRKRVAVGVQICAVSSNGSLLAWL